MRRLDIIVKWITLIFLCILVFGSIEPISAEGGAEVVQTVLALDMPVIYTGSLSNMLSVLVGTFNNSPANPTKGNQSILNAVKDKKINYSILVYINNSNLTVEDDNGKVITTRKAGLDDAGAVKEAINKTDRGTVLCMGTFRILSPIDNLKGNIDLKGIPGQTVFDCSMMKSAVFPCGGSGYAEHTTLLSSDVREGSDSISIKDAKIYHEGDFVKLTDDEGIVGFKKGEILRIEKISGNRIIFDGAVRDGYTVKNAANIRSVTMARNITVEGIGFLGPGEETDLVLFNLNLLDHFRFANNEVANFGRAAISLSDSLDSAIENNTFGNIYMTGFGYSISVTNACKDIYIIDNIFKVKGRHYIAAGAGTGSRNSGGFVRNLKIINNSFENCVQEAINTHLPFKGPIEIRSNTFKSCGKGIEVSNGNTVIIGNSFMKCLIGIQLLGDEERIHNIYSNEFNECEKKIIVQMGNVTVSGDLDDNRFRMKKGELDFF